MLQLEQKVHRFIVKSFLFTEDLGAVGREDSLLGRGIMDSTGILELVFFLEKEFGIKVDDVELLPENLDSVARIASFVAKKSGSA